MLPGVADPAEQGDRVQGDVDGGMRAPGRRQRRRPARTAPRLAVGRAASQAAAVESSARANSRAHLCLIAWNEPMVGRTAPVPWHRPARSAGTSGPRRPTPRRTASRPGRGPGQWYGQQLGVRDEDTVELAVAMSLVRSTGSAGVMTASPSSGPSRTNHSAPPWPTRLRRHRLRAPRFPPRTGFPTAPSTRTRALAAPRTGAVCRSPASRRDARGAQPGRRHGARRVAPPARAGSSRLARAFGAWAVISWLAKTVGSSGPGSRPKAASSSTTASSTRPRRHRQPIPAGGWRAAAARRGPARTIAARPRRSYRRRRASR